MWRSSRVHYCYSSLAFFLSQAGDRKGPSACNEFWKDSHNIGSRCIVPWHVAYRDTYLYVILLLTLSIVIMNSLDITQIIADTVFITHEGSFEVIICTQKEAVLILIPLSWYLTVSSFHMESYAHTLIQSQNVWTKWWCAVAVIMICICCVLGGDTWIFNCVC